MLFGVENQVTNVMSKTTLHIILTIAVLLTPVSARAVTLEAFDTRLSIHAYMDLEYTYMGKMPMDPGGMGPVTAGEDLSTIDQENLNLIFQANRDRFIANVNLEFHEAFQTGFDNAGASEGHGNFGVLEAFGEYQQSDALKVRGGTFLAPFGLYNQIRFASPLFAPVVLPTMYEPPGNYEDSGGMDHLVPEEGNLMVHGVLGAEGPRLKYAAYLGTGHRRGDGEDENKNKVIGARVMALFGENTAGASVYSARDEDGNGHRLHLVGSLDLSAGNLNFQGEVMTIESRANNPNAVAILSYYGRLSYKMGDATPFIGFDYLEDGGNTLYRDGMYRWSAGVGHDVSSTVFLKAEYHYHKYDAAAIKAVDADAVHMIRLAAIMVF